MNAPHVILYVKVVASSRTQTLKLFSLFRSFTRLPLAPHTFCTFMNAILRMHSSNCIARAIDAHLQPKDDADSFGTVLVSIVVGVAVAAGGRKQRQFIDINYLACICLSSSRDLES